MRILVIAAVALGLAGCASSSSSPRLGFAEPLPSYHPDIVAGAAHPDDLMDPYDPADQQRNQAHGLAPLPGDRDYY
jgi:hypothetical protein